MQDNTYIKNPGAMLAYTLFVLCVDIYKARSEWTRL